MVGMGGMLVGIALVSACGDSATEPVPDPVPDPPRPTAVTVNPATAELAALGASVQLTAEVRDQNERAMAGATVIWSSSSASVATVAQSGLVTAVADGTAVIAASVSDGAGPPGTAVVTVKQVADSAWVSPPAETIGVGNSLQLTAEAFDENGHSVVGAEFIWSSSNDAVARVAPSGLVRGVAEGVAAITARSGSAEGAMEIAVGPNAERASLVALYHATNGPNWINAANWLTDAPPGAWHGVDTDHLGRVVGLDLGLNALAGELPPEFGNLTSLKSLNLSHNFLRGAIPPELGNLASLEHLYLGSYGGGNKLVGEIPPELGNLASLKRLELTYNALTGAIPPELGNLASLEDLSLGDNNLTGPIPPEFGNLTSLERLGLNGNALTGAIPPELGNLASLTELELSSNGLTGAIPSELGNLASLTELELSSNGLTGPIPSELGNLARLERLLLGANNLSGTIPPQLGNLARLERLWLGANNLSGAIPSELGNLASLTYLWLDGNAGLCVPGTESFERFGSLSGGAEFSWCNEADVVALEALHAAAGGNGWRSDDGWLGGPILEAWNGIGVDALGRVTTLNLSNNGLSGSLPSSLGNLARVRVLRLGGNAGLSGRLPTALSRLPDISVLDYAETRLCAPAEPVFQAWLSGVETHTGTGLDCVPFTDRDALEALYHATGGPRWTENSNWLTDAPLGEWYGVDVNTLGRVSRLDLANNALTGAIPPELGNLASLEWLSLDSNQLTGAIPPELGNLASLKRLALTYNALTGEVPPELGNLDNLEELTLWYNNLTGAIPPELGSLASLKSLAVSFNGLTGEVPPELGSLASLENLNLRSNAAHGRDSAGVGQPHQPDTSAARQQPAHGHDPAGAGRPRQPGSAEA